MNRRDLLRFGAAGLIAGPFLRLLNPVARAEGATARRLLIFMTPEGHFRDYWRPTSAAGLVFPEDGELVALSEHAEDLLLVESTYHDTANHGPATHHALTGGGDHSLDQIVAEAIGGSSPMKSINLGVRTGAIGGWGLMTRRNGFPHVPYDVPLGAWERMFAVKDETVVERRAALLDIAAADLSRLKSRLGSTEAAQLDAYTESLYEVQRSLTASGSCTDPERAPELNALDNDAVPDVTRAQIDLAIQGLACGVTRVATIQVGTTTDQVVFTWLGHGADHHSLAHSGSTNTRGGLEYLECQRWYAEQFAYLLDVLKATPDPEGGTLFDSTLVLWATEFGDPRYHTCEDVGWILAGGQAFTPNRFVQTGTTHNRVLGAIALAMGVDVGSIGNGDGGGPLTDLF